MRPTLPSSRRLLPLCFMLMASVSVWAQPLPAYLLYDAKGKKTSHKKMMGALAKADVVLFGELHNNPIAHWLQLAVSKELLTRQPIALGAEMLEADDQATLDSYLKGEIDRKALDTLARLWNNYATDYAPLVELAKTKELRFIATNVPRRYASMVYKNGFGVLDTLPDRDKQWMAPLPIDYDPELPGYKDMLTMMGGHGGDNLPKAQALKDATMAHFILANRTDGTLFIHFNGAYHSDRYEGIRWYLRKARPDLKYVTISTISQKDINTLETDNLGKADFIICVDEDMPGSY
jgi:uncharacterized iron-regulated protein